MAISAIIRRAVTSAARIVTAAHRNYHSSSAASVLRRPTAIGPRNNFLGSHQRFCFSSLAEEKVSDAELVKIIESEITCAEECDDHDRVSTCQDFQITRLAIWMRKKHVEEIPQGFPFEIRDEKGKNIVILKSKCQDEHIEVTVFMPSLVTGEEPDDNRVADNVGEEDGGDDERPSQSSVPLTVNVTKGSGPSLEFHCTAYPDEVTIDSMSVTEATKPEEEVLAYEGPDFNDLDENLQRAFHKYLELRGITAFTTNFLHEYMINKDSREYLHWLKNLKEFVEE